MQLVTEEVPAAIAPCRELLARADRPTAVFLAGNGATIMGLRIAAVSLGLSIPADVSIIGFPGPQISDCPDHSVIELPRHDLAKIAVETVLKLANPDAEQPPETCVLNCRIHWRGSTGAPSARNGNSL